jgi:Cysteine sulfinate desulfinase/cysteine desulfurase and related enzymes
MIYFDNSATTKPDIEVIREVNDCMEHTFGNPSSAHKLGIEAEGKIKKARERVSRLIGSQPKEILFTSGGSESNNMVLKGLTKPGDHIISSKLEHPSIMSTLKVLEENGVEVTYLDVNNQGVINLEQLAMSIRENTRLVTAMYVNNEIGVIEPIEDMVKIIKEKNSRIKVHVDAVQGAGKLNIDVKKAGIDLMSVSAHKIHGPKGVGALYIRSGISVNPLISGGGQENNLRSGTENVPGISGFGVAAEIILKNMQTKIEHVNTIKRHFINRLSEIDNIKINSPMDAVHIGNILNVSFNGIRGEVLLHALEDYDIFVSTGSACSAKKISHKNYVLPAIGLNETSITGAIRFSFSYFNTIDEVDAAIDAIKKILPFLRRIKS